MRPWSLCVLAALVPSSHALNNMSTLATTKAALQNSWVRQLSPETPENLQKSRRAEGLPSDDKNKRRRPVYNGHYVLVEPTGLQEPRLVLYSTDVAQQLELDPESDDFLQWVSGNLNLGESWATPYALSIMGKRYTNNCPYGTGDGYGDGRAISIGELNNLELQLKGGGTTPFHRGADGRAVLRSSIREFLASEAMHYLGIETTRALSLVVSEKDKIMRPWYQGNDSVTALPTSVDDPRLARFPEEQRPLILRQIRNQKMDPNTMIQEKAAITCRVAPSFVRVGHLDLFSRRAQLESMKNAETTDSNFDTSTLAWKELEQMIWHACYREYRAEAYDPFIDSKDIVSAANVLLEKAAERLATMVAGWIRVGFAQGNFNADNCLVGGRTMDYGPFGFLEEYNPVFAKWTGSGEHFGFMNQPSAGFANYQVLVESVVPVICAQTGTEAAPTAKAILEKAVDVFQAKVDEVFRVKLGFEPDMDVGDDVWASLEPLLQKSRCDWTLFFRQLTYVLRDFADSESFDYQAMLETIEGKETQREGSSPFYEPLSSELRREWFDWIELWRNAIISSGAINGAFDRMKSTNPKYVLREWMLVEAYSAASDAEEAELFYLYDLIQRPYDEGSESEVRKYYRRAPAEALMAGGTAYMS